MIRASRTQRRWLRTTCLLAIIVSAPAGANIIEFRPQTVGAELGESVAVDIFATALEGEIVSAYDLDITYDSLILAATNVTFGTGLGDALFFEVFESFDVSMPGIVDLAQLSLLSDASLLGIQGGSDVYLATIFFDTFATGVSMLDFVFDPFNDVKTFDAEILPVTGNPGQVVVSSPPVAVPEPPAWALMTVGLALLLHGRRRFAPTVPGRSCGRRPMPLSSRSLPGIGEASYSSPQGCTIGWQFTVASG